MGMTGWDGTGWDGVDKSSRGVSTAVLALEVRVCFVSLGWLRQEIQLRRCCPTPPHRPTWPRRRGAVRCRAVPCGVVAAGFLGTLSTVAGGGSSGDGDQEGIGQAPPPPPFHFFGARVRRLLWRVEGTLYSTVAEEELEQEQERASPTFPPYVSGLVSEDFYGGKRESATVRWLRRGWGRGGIP